MRECCAREVLHVDVMHCTLRERLARTGVIGAARRRCIADVHTYIDPSKEELVPPLKVWAKVLVDISIQCGKMRYEDMNLHAWTYIGPYGIWAK